MQGKVKDNTYESQFSLVYIYYNHVDEYFAIMLSTLFAFLSDVLFNK